MFIKKIEFNKNKVPKNIFPFKESDEIIFGGQDQIKDLILFYKNDEENAKRIKVNSILANNGGGKTRFFELFQKHFIDNSIVFTKLKNKEKDIINIQDENGKNISKDDYEVILDDFFVLSKNKDYSINKDLLELGYNNFYCNVCNFLQSNTGIKKLFGNFLNLNKDYEVNLKFTYNLDWRNGKWISFSGDKEYSDNNSVFNNYIYDDEYERLKFFFDTLNQGITDDNNFLRKKFKLKKEDLEKIRINLGDLFLATINNFDLSNYTINGTLNYQGISGTEYKNFKEVLILLESFIELLKKYYNNNKTQLEKVYEGIDFLHTLNLLKTNLAGLQKLLKYIETYNEDEDLSVGSHIPSNKLQDYFFNFKYKEEVNLLDKLQNSVHTSQAIHLVDKILSGYSDKEYINEDNRRNLDNLIMYFMKKRDEITIKKSINNSIKEIEKEFLLTRIFDLDLIFSDGTKELKTFEDLSGGEKSMLSRFTNIYMKIMNTNKSNFIILIDEPDLNLHLDWQRQYIQKLIDVFSTIDKDIKMHFILATHSPFIVSDLPNESIVLFDKSENNKYKGEFTENKEYENKSFGANYVDLIRDGFFFENKVLMGSFAEKIIGGIGKNELEAVRNGKEDFEGKELKNQIGDDFLRDNLLYFKVEKDD